MRGFKQVIVTCRTQFFPDHKIDHELDRVVLGGFKCRFQYLSLFSNEQVDLFLSKRYPWRRLWLHPDREKFRQAETVVFSMKSLKMRPMLLSYVDSLRKLPVEHSSNAYRIYDHLMSEWLGREAQKISAIGASEQTVRAACRRLAEHLHCEHKTSISLAELESFLAKDDRAFRAIKAFEFAGKSLMNKQTGERYRFAHRSIQEFLVAERLVLEEGDREIVLTDQIAAFLEARLGEDPERHGRALPWARIHCDLDFVEIAPRVVGFAIPRIGEVPLWMEIPAGKFVMGSDRGGDNEKPRHRVEITSPFRIFTTPVTNKLFQLFRPDFEPHAWDGVSAAELPFHPAVKVDWNDARNFCDWLAERYDWAKGARLPTEAEWEYACRAGTTTEYWSGSDTKDLDRVGWYADNSSGRTHRVGEKTANAWGLHDVHGNVWEWTLGPWRSSCEGRSDVRHDPSDFKSLDLAAAASAPGDAGRVICGGSFVSTAAGCRSAFRNYRSPRFVNRDLGFRVVVPVPRADH